MYLENWDEYQKQVEELYKASPMNVIVINKTRYVSKYRHCDGKLVLKVTDSILVRFSNYLVPEISHRQATGFEQV